MSLRGRSWVLGWAALLSLACSDKPEGSDALLYGVGNLVSVHDMVFVLSADRNELRALSLNSSSRVRGPHFVPAINPLEPLSIPVLDYPNMLAGDVRWEEEVLESGELIPQGKVVGGPFVYVASHGRSGISIVGGTEAWLKQLQYFPTSAPVTALAAYRGSHSTLFFATYDGNEGSLWALDLEDEQTVHALSSEDLLARPIQIQDDLGQKLSLEARVITALSVLPGGALAVAVRTAGGASAAALYLSDDTQTTWRTVALEQAFRMLATHASARHAEHANGLLPAGKWLYALLDEGSCTQEPCESGIVAVDVEKGALVFGVTGLPIPSVGGLPISLGFVPLTLKDKEADVDRETLAGIYVTGSGLLGMFDAAIPASLETTQVVHAAFFAPDATGAPVETDYVEGPLRNEDGTWAVQVVSGASFNEKVLIEIKPWLPEVVLENSALDTLRFEPVANTSRVREGDVLEVFVGEELCEELLVGAKEEQALLLTQASSCSGERHFKLRAGDEDPYVVKGEKTGYLGRGGPNQSFFYPHPGKPILSIEFGSASSPKILPGAHWELVLTSGYFGASRDIQSFSRCSTRIAAGVWIDSMRKKAYISFSSSNALVEVDIGAWLEGSLGEAEVVCYR